MKVYSKIFTKSPVHLGDASFEVIYDLLKKKKEKKK